MDSRDLRKIAEAYTLTRADKVGNTKAWQDRDKKNVKTGEPLYTKADHLKKEGYQRDPEQQEKERKTSKQTDPSKDGFTGISNSIADIMKQNAAMKKAAAKKTKKEELEASGLFTAEEVEAINETDKLEESEKLARGAYKRAQDLGAKRRRSKDPSGIYKSERAGYNLSQSQRSRNTDTATQGGPQTGGGPKDFGYARHKKNPVKSKSIGDTGAQGHRKKANEKITHGKKGQKLKTPRYKLSAKQRSDHHSDVWKREELRDPKKNPKHTANTNKPPKKEVSGKDTNVDLKKEEFLNQDLLSKMGRFMPKKSQTHRIDEEGYDHWRDKQLEKYGTGYRGTGPSGDRSGPSPRPTGKQPKGDTVYQKELKKKYGGRLPSAVEVVRDKIKAKYGSNAIASSSSDRQAHQEKNYPNSSVVKGSIKGGKGVK